MGSGQSNSSASGVLCKHSTWFHPCQPIGFLSGVNPESRTKNKPWEWQGMAYKQKNTSNKKKEQTKYNEDNGILTVDDRNEG